VGKISLGVDQDHVDVREPALALGNALREEVGVDDTFVALE
jgi:hypothetical protein